MKLDAILSREILPESEKNFVKKLEPDQTKTPEHTVQKKSASTSKLSGLFVGQQTDHSQYVRASLASSQASQKAMNNRFSAMISLLQAQIAYEDQRNSTGENDLSYSRRSRIGARAAALLEMDMTKEVNRTTKLESEKDSEAKETTSTDEALPVQDVSAGRPVASATPKVKSTPKAVSISIRI